MMTRRRLLVSAVLGFAVLAVIGCFGLATVAINARRWLDPFEARSFDRTAWDALDSEGRAAMARDAIRRLPTGTPEAEIQALLGPCSIKETRQLVGSSPGGPLPLFSGTAPPHAVRTYSYSLGCWSLAYYDSTYLWVHVGEDGRVINAVIGGG